MQSDEKAIISSYMSKLGKQSSVIRKGNGHDSDYYRNLVNKRWSKRKMTLSQAINYNPFRKNIGKELQTLKIDL